MRSPIRLRLLKVKRHLRSCTARPRALRDAARLLATVPVGPPMMECLCRPSCCRLAA
jgi:hypothetical protein